MNDTVTLISTIANATPFALMVFIVLGLLLFAGRVFIPGLRVTIEMFEAQRAAWESLIERLNRVNARLVEELDKDLKAAVEASAALEKRIDTLEAQLADKDRRIEELEGKIAELSRANEEKDRIIAKLREDLDEVKREREALAKQRDELLARMDAIDEKHNGESKGVGKPGEKPPEKEKSNPEEGKRNVQL